ncbi:MAG TPA: cyclic nucleotide-binding domain-containing protein [Roseiflexaceae bacterium]|nr:cyclic nucleotide-binding domain-containing protein [Roseiflexaceae bacterium]
MSTDETTASGPIVPDATTLSQDPAFIEYAIRTLGDSELAEGLSPDQLARLATIGTARQHNPGEVIAAEHERTDELYIIEAGSVEVWLDPSNIGDDIGPERQIATLQAGQTCGELALLDGGLRSAQLRAGAHGTRLTAFSRDALLQLCEADTTIGFRLMRNLAAALALRLRLQSMRLYSAD